MPIVKKTDAPSIPVTAVEQIVAKVTASAPVVPSYKARDYDGEARGKTRCALYEAALQSPVIANFTMTCNGLEEALKLVEDAANAGFKYVFPNEN
jgi:hypothetical protein